MDQILSDHSPKHLEKTFNALFLHQTESYSVIAQKTEIPWLQFIPKQAIDSGEQAGNIYCDIHDIAFHLQRNGFGHFNIAKIGNKHPAYHIHLVFRDTTDEVWPDAIWCHAIQQSDATAENLKQQLAEYFK